MIQTWNTIKYDNGASGTLNHNFARNAATVGINAQSVSANQPRYGAKQLVCGDVNWQASGIDLGTTAALLSAGPDFDETPLVVVNNSSVSALQVYAINTETMAITLASSTLLTALPQASGSITYVPRSAVIYHGLIAIECQRTVSSVIAGVSLFVSQDRGVTWTEVQNAVINGGGYGVPTPSAYGANANAIDRGAVWSMSVFPHAGIAADGTYDKTIAWITWSDYLSAASSPKGYQMGLFKITRDSEDDLSWTIGRSRVVRERWEASAAASLHGHSLAMTGSGRLYAFVGDTAPHNCVDYIELEIDNYETAEVTFTDDWHGECNPGTAHAKMSPQPTHPVPAAGGGVLCAADLTPSVVQHYNDVTSAAQAVTITPRFSSHGDSISGVFLRGREPLSLYWYPGVGYTCGGNAASPGSDKDPLRLFSPDGVTWGQLPNSDAIRGLTRGVHVLAGNFLLGIRTSDEALMIARIPEYTTLRPLLVNRGGTNLASSASSLDQYVAPTSPNTVSAVTWNGAKFVFTSGGADVPNAPAVPAPLNNPVYVYLGGESTAAAAHGALYVQPTGQNYDHTLPLNVDFCVANLMDDATIAFWGQAGYGSPGNRTAERGILIDSSPGVWRDGILFGQPSSAGGRGAMWLQGGLTGTAPNLGPMLVAIGGMYQSNFGSYPVARATSSAAHEIETVKFPSQSGTPFTVATCLIRQAKSYTTGELTNASGTLFTINTTDADSYVTVAWDGTNAEVEVTPTVNGVAGTTITLAAGYWWRNQPLQIIISDNGTKLDVTVCSPRLGLVSGSSASGSVGFAASSVVFSNFAQTEVYGLQVAGVGQQPVYMEQPQREEAARTLSWLTLQEETIADAAASAVRSALAVELARIDVATSTRNATVPLSAAGTRAAIGLGSANLDTQLAAKANQSSVDNLATEVGDLQALEILSGQGRTNFTSFFNNGGAASTKTINNVTAPKNVTITVPNP